MFGWRASFGAVAGNDVEDSPPRNFPFGRLLIMDDLRSIMRLPRPQKTTLELLSSSEDTQRLSQDVSLFTNSPKAGVCTS